MELLQPTKEEARRLVGLPENPDNDTLIQFGVDNWESKTISQLGITSSDIADFDAQVRASALNQMALPTAPLDLNAQQIQNLTAIIFGANVDNSIRLIVNNQMTYRTTNSHAFEINENDPAFEIFPDRLYAQKPLHFTQTVKPISTAEEVILYSKTDGPNMKLFYLDSDGNEIGPLGAASEGEVNTASNLGVDTFGLFANKVGEDLQFKSLIAGTNVILSQDATGITIAAAAIPDDSITNAKLAAGLFPKITGIGVQTEQLDMNTNKITNLAAPTNDDDAATRKFVEDRIITEFNFTDLQGVIASDQIPDSIITTQKINNLAVNNSKLGGSSVSTTKIIDGAVTGIKIADATIALVKLNTSGIPTVNNFLRGDGAWAVPPGGGEGGALDSLNGDQTPAQTLTGTPEQIIITDDNVGGHTFTIGVNIVTLAGNQTLTNKSLSAAQITGILAVAQIPDLTAAKITAGTFDDARIPNLDAAKIFSGEFDVLRIPDLTAAKITDFANTVTANAAVSLNTAKITNAIHTGDVTGGGVLTISDDAVTNAKIAAGLFPKITGLGVQDQDLDMGGLDIDNVSDINPFGTTLDINGSIRLPRIDAFIELTDNTNTPANPSAARSRFYPKLLDGVSVPYWLDSAGTETNMLTGGGGAGGAIDSINGDNTAAQTLTGTPEQIIITDNNIGGHTFTIGVNIVTLAGNQTLTNKSLTANQITDFANTVTANAAVSLNTAKITNAIHTGAVTGGTILSISDNAVTDGKIESISLSKILASGAANGQVPTWDGANYTPQTPSGGGGTINFSDLEGTIALDQIANQLITGPKLAARSVNINKLAATPSGGENRKILIYDEPNTDFNLGSLDEIIGTLTAAQFANDTITINKLDVTGVPGNTNFLRGDGTWAVPEGGGSGGAIDSINGDNTAAQTLTGTPEQIIITDDNVGGHTFTIGVNIVTLAGNQTLTNKSLSAAQITGILAVAQIPNLTAAKITNFANTVTANAAVSLNTAKITNATHTGDVIGNTALTIIDGAVTGAKIADNTISNDKINEVAISKLQQNNATNGQVLTWVDGVGEWRPATPAAGGEIPDNSIVNAKLAEGLFPKITGIGDLTQDLDMNGNDIDNVDNIIGSTTTVNLFGSLNFGQLDSHIQFENNRLTPANPPNQRGRLYSKLVNNVAVPYWLDSAGTETNMVADQLVISGAMPLVDDRNIFSAIGMQDWKDTITPADFADVPTSIKITGFGFNFVGAVSSGNIHFRLQRTDADGTNATILGTATIPAGQKSIRIITDIDLISGPTQYRYYWQIDTDAGGALRSREFSAYFNFREI